MRYHSVDHARTMKRRAEMSLRDAELIGDEAAILVAASRIASAQRYIDAHDTLEEFLDVEDEDGRPLRGRAGRNSRSRRRS